MNKIVLTIATGALTLAGSSNAAIVWSFAPGAASPSSGFTVINNFNTGAGISGSNFLIKIPPADRDGAPPASSVPNGSPYLSVLAGGSANISLGGLFSKVQFDWGSIDAYNSLSVFTTGVDPVIIPGSNFINPANGNQMSPSTNGLFTVYTTAGEKISGIGLSSSGNSFEIDNLAVGVVPEPAIWGLMIAGFAAVGVASRYRRQGLRSVAA